MKYWLSGLLLLSCSLGVCAQSVDEQLLAAQTAYQQGDTVMAQADARLKTAEAAKQLTDARLRDAQVAQQRSDADLASARQAQEAAKQTMQQLSDAVSEAWKRKDAGQ